MRFLVYFEYNNKTWYKTLLDIFSNTSSNLEVCIYLRYIFTLYILNWTRIIQTKKVIYCKICNNFYKYAIHLIAWKMRIWNIIVNKKCNEFIIKNKSINILLFKIKNFRFSLIEIFLKEITKHQVSLLNLLKKNKIFRNDEYKNISRLVDIPYIYFFKKTCEHSL